MRIETDVCAWDNELRIVQSAEDGTLAIHEYTTQLDTILLFLRGACQENTGVTAVIGTRHSGGNAVAYNSLGDVRDVSIAPVHGNYAAYIRSIPEGFELFWITWPGAGDNLDGWRRKVDERLNNLPNEEAVKFDATTAGSQGFLDVAPNGTPIFTNHNDSLMIGEVQLRNPLFRKGLVIGQHQDSNHILVYSLETGHFWSASDKGTQTHPRLAVAGDGVALAATSGEPPNVFPSELWNPWVPAVEYPPVTDMAPLNRPFAFGYFSFNNMHLPGANVVTPIRPTGRIPGDKVTLIPMPGIELYGLWCPEDANTTCEQMIDRMRPDADRLGVGLCVYQDSPGVRQSVLAKLKPWDTIMPQLYRDKNDTQWKTHFRQWANIPHARVMPVVGVHNRNGSLTDLQVVEAVVYCSHLAREQQWFGVDYFRIGTSDFVQRVLPYLQYQWMSVTGLPDQPVPEDEDMETKAAVSLEVVNFNFGSISQGMDGRRKVSAIYGDEIATIIKNSDSSHSIKSPNGEELVSVQPDGSIGYRKASDPNQPGPWEKFVRKGSRLIELPKYSVEPYWRKADGSGRDPVAFAAVYL